MRAAIIGAGRVGTALARFLARKGFTIATVISRSIESARIAGETVAAGVVSTSPRDVPPDAEVVIIAVPDAAIADCAKELALAAPAARPRLVFHTSGLESSSLLIPVRSAMNVTGSLHPIQSFPDREMEIDSLEEIWCGVEGSPEFVASASGFATRIGWHPVEIQAHAKPLYHAACVFAGNLLTAIPSAAREALIEAGCAPETAMAALRPMMEAVLHRVADPAGAHASLTGPFARNDAVAIRRHLEALRPGREGLSELYTALGMYLSTIRPVSQAVRDALQNAAGRGHAPDEV